MVLPIEIQKLILTRYYFNQWKQMIGKVNQQYHQSFVYNIKNGQEGVRTTDVRFGDQTMGFNWRKHEFPLSIMVYREICNLQDFYAGKSVFTSGKRIQILPKNYFYSRKLI